MSKFPTRSTINYKKFIYVKIKKEYIQKYTDLYSQLDKIKKIKENYFELHFCGVHLQTTSTTKDFSETGEDCYLETVREFDYFDRAQFHVKESHLE